MADIELKPLPLGTSDFSVLRSAGQIYVDKTALIYELASKRQKFFLARPRRFGKSLLISTFESLFKYGLRDFKGLAIENLWKEESNYQVVRLDFSRVKPGNSAKEFASDLDEYLTFCFEEIGFKRADYGSIFNQIERFLKRMSGSSLVLLIDEYDAPLTACMNNLELFNAVRKNLSDFYAVIKSNDGAVRFFFMTGITKFNKTGIFSELNNLKDISLLPNFGALLGYTHEEVTHNFNGYLVESAKQLGIEEDKLLKELTRYYDGFCFERTAKCHVFAPWSLLNFFSEPGIGFVNYWYESGGQPKVLLEYIKSHNIRQPSEYLAEKEVSLDGLSASSSVSDVDDNVLLAQAGYLTVKKVEGDTVTLGYPNQEVAQSMARLYTEVMLSKDAMNRAGKRFLTTLLKKGDAPGFVKELNKIFLGVDYTKYPVQDEASCRAAVYLMLRCTGLEPLMEVHNGLGRSDMEVDTGDIHWVLEFKFTKEKDSARELCEKGKEQVKTRRYGEQFERKQLRRLVLVFVQKEKQFVCWEEVDGYERRSLPQQKP